MNANTHTQALEEALAAFVKGKHTPEQFSLLVEALPPDVRAEMDKRASQILGIDLAKPDAYAEDGEPLWSLDPKKFIDEGLITEEDAQGFFAKHQAYVKKPDPKVTVFDNRVKLSSPPFVKTDQVDEDGEPVYMCSPVGAAIMNIDMALEHNTGVSNCPKAVEIFNRWMALARQHGVSGIVIERLRKATKEKADNQRLLADIAKVTEKVSIIDAFGVPVVSM